MTELFPQTQANTLSFQDFKQWELGLLNLSPDQIAQALRLPQDLGQKAVAVSLEQIAA